MGNKTAMQLLEKLIYYIADTGTADALIKIFRIYLNEIIYN
jgi:hypothetical protein